MTLVLLKELQLEPEACTQATLHAPAAPLALFATLHGGCPGSVDIGVWVRERDDAEWLRVGGDLRVWFGGWLMQLPRVPQGWQVYVQAFRVPYDMQAAQLEIVAG